MDIIQGSVIVNLSSNETIGISMPNSTPSLSVFAIPSSGRLVVQAMHPFSKLWKRSLKQQVIMVGKNNPCPHFSYAAFGQSGKQI